MFPAPSINNAGHCPLPSGLEEASSTKAENFIRQGAKRVVPATSNGAIFHTLFTCSARQKNWRKKSDT